MLDNAYFVKPVNQLMQTEYTGEIYGIDRWIAKWTGTDGVVSVIDGCISLYRPAYSAHICQFLENPKKLAGEKITFSVLAKSGSGGETGILIYATSTSNSEPYIIAVTGDNSINYNVIECSAIVPDDVVSLFVDITSANAKKSFIKAAKLELGHIQTLAHKENDKWVLNSIPNYALELSKCQRYQCVFNVTIYKMFSLGIAVSSTEIIFFIHLPSSLRSKPTCTVKNIFALNTSNLESSSNAKEISITQLHIAENIVRLTVSPKNTGDTFVTGDMYQLISTNSNGTLLFDSNL